MSVRKWTFEKLKLEALNHKTRGNFNNKNPNAYDAALRMGILNEICSHMEFVRKSWDSYSDIQKEALKYTSRSQFMKHSKGAYKAAVRLGILDKVCSRMEFLHQDWSNIRKIYKEAKKYSDRTEFARKNSAAYHAAQRAGILDKVCSHMDVIYQDWADTNKIHKEALKYKTRGEFAKISVGAYMAATRMGILDIVCSHMKKSRCSSLMEIELFDIIKSHFFSAKKFRDRTVKIENKPYIHGFEVDIFIPELKLGIEFDGKHHHTFEYMRKDRAKKHWSDEDIRNYHEIKDSWFATRGVSILHIKEIDWTANKRACIDKCLEFLGSRT